MSNKTRGRQKKIEKQKKKRELAKREARSRAVVVPTSLRGIIRLACKAPCGPAWVSELDYADSEGAPSLATVVITKVLPQGQFLAQMLLVDRTCLGVKDTTLFPPMDERALSNRLAELSESSEVHLQPCDPLVAQSVVFHALDYAEALGFQPHPDFVAGLVGPRPSELLDTPLAHPERPLFIAGPYDNAPSILARLEAAVGPANYDILVANRVGEDGGEELGCDCEDCDAECEDCADHACICGECVGHDVEAVEVGEAQECQPEIAENASVQK